ncbi:DEAD/DEAH box helicase [Persicobacter psychrovividus]|uniref:DEAD/DEAH box helicase n=1 Tax=Persicobacter psychrovividus TaxID=387638 RepID=A0ABN6LCW3_9BACT|nr:DEAD/DEAH box helicase [Persicobacter psychrovividus]
MQNFQETGLRNELLDAITEMGFETPSPIQSKTIPHILSTDQDLVALAQTGTGKTAAFGLPILHRIDPKSKNAQLLILSPTRELCIQIATEMERFLKYMGDVKVVSVYGGAPIDSQIRAIKRGAQVIVGTPGRTIDLLNRRVLNFSNINWLVLDEADEMLNMGFKEDLNTILSSTSDERQTLLFSATMPKEIQNIADNYMTNPLTIKMGKRNVASDDVKHFYYLVHGSDRYETIKRVADMNPDIYGIIFSRTRAEAKDIAEKLQADGYNADALHGELSQGQRDQVMNRFRNKQLKLLVATDVAARGLDVNELTHVINYNLPDDSEVYVHRSGRTGRAGNKGISVAIVSNRDVNRIKDIERFIGKKFEKQLVPGGDEVCKARLFSLMSRVENVDINEEQIAPFMEEITAQFAEMSREELIKHFVSVEFNQILSYYKNARDLNIQERKQRDRRDKENSKFTRFYINLGEENEGFNKLKMIGMINDNLPKRKVEIGKIDILQKFSFFEVDSNYENDVLDAFSNLNFGESKVLVEKKKGKERSGGFKGNRRGGSGGGFRGNRRSGGGGGGSYPRNGEGRKPRYRG